MLRPVTLWNEKYKNNPSKKLTVHVRLNVGLRAPATWRARAGTVYMTDLKWDEKGDMPIWWKGEYGRLYTNAWRVLGPLLDSRTDIGSVNNPMAASFYPEPFLLFGEENEARLVNAKWSIPLQKEAMFRDLRTPSLYTRRVIVYLDINPTTFPTGKTVEMDFMWALVEKHITYYPKGRAGIENYSVRIAHISGDGNYQKMLKGIAARSDRAWTSVQLARPKVIGGATSDTVTVWPEVAGYWERLGGHAVETTGNNPTDGRANVWTGSYVNRQGIMEKQDADFARNPHP